MTLEIKISKKLIPYKSAFIFLKKRVDSLKKQKGEDLLWILEHPLTFTGGIRSKKNEINTYYLENSKYIFNYFEEKKTISEGGNKTKILTNFSFLYSFFKYS